jgi:hypothetical protein
VKEVPSSRREDKWNIIADNLTTRFHSNIYDMHYYLVSKDSVFLYFDSASALSPWSSDSSGQWAGRFESLCVSLDRQTGNH